MHAVPRLIRGGAVCTVLRCSAAFFYNSALAPGPGHCMTTIVPLKLCFPTTVCS